MGSFFEALAKKLAERWLTLLLIPGALFVAAAVLGGRLGQRAALDYPALQRIALVTEAEVARLSGGGQVLLLVAFLLASAATGLVVQGLAGPVRRGWLGPWPRPLAGPQRWLTSRRRARWHRRLALRRELEQAHPRGTRTAEQQQAIDAAAERVNQLALAQPGRPTWMGDRIDALEQIARNRYGLDLSFTWPRLWLVLPENVRVDLTTAQAAFAAAVAAAAWAWPYLVLGLWWWPSAVIGLGIGVVGRVRGRAAVTDLTTLTEAALDLHGSALAVALGLAPDASGPLTIELGERITALVRKGR